MNAGKIRSCECPEEISETFASRDDVVLVQRERGITLDRQEY